LKESNVIRFVIASSHRGCIATGVSEGTGDRGRINVKVGGVIMAYHIKLKDRRYLLTEKDYLINGDSWDNEIRDWLANKAGLELDEEHLEAIEFIRTTYNKRKQHPNPRVIAANLAKKYGPDKGTLRYFYSLFPKGVQQAFAIAGVPMQGFCF